MQKLVVREYTKTQLRILLANPEADPLDPHFYLLRRMTEKKFRELMQPLVVAHCQRYITLEEYTRCKVLPVKVVQTLFNKLDL